MGRTGRETIVALGNSVAWRTPVAPGATDGIIPLSVDQLTLQGDSIPDEGIANLTEIQYMDVIRHTANPTITLHQRRTGTQFVFLAHLMGDDTKSGVGPYTHTMTYQPESGLFVTMAMEIGGSDIIEWPSLKTTGITIEPDGDGFEQWVVSTMGDTINIAGDATSASGDFDAVTYVTKTLRTPSRELRLRLNAQGGAALGSGDQVKQTSHSLVFNRPYSPEEVSQSASTGVEYTTDEPVQNGFSEITLGFDVPDYTTIALLDDFHDETQYKADLYWAKTVTTAFTYLIELGALEPIPASAAAERGQRIPLTRNFRALQPQSAPTGMATSNIIHVVVADNSNITYETNNA